MDTKPSALIIEDDRDIVALFRHVLDLAGYRTEIVLHGKVAVEHLAKYTPDIVLLDLGLPGVSGSEILVMMREDERLKNVPVVVITAHAHLVETLPVAPQLVLIKPVNIEQLSNLIVRICPTEKSMDSLPWDVLTGVYNRSFFMARLSYALERAKQLHQSRFAVLYLDLGNPTRSITCLVRSTISVYSRNQLHCLGRSCVPQILLQGPVDITSRS